MAVARLKEPIKRSEMKYLLTALVIGMVGCKEKSVLTERSRQWLINDKLVRDSHLFKNNKVSICAVQIRKFSNGYFYVDDGTGTVMKTKDFKTWRKE